LNSSSYDICTLDQGSLLKQLAIANKSIGGGVVVVLAERDKEEMEMDIAKLEFDFMGTSVICRSGSPLILADLKKVEFSEIILIWLSLLHVLWSAPFDDFISFHIRISNNRPQMFFFSGFCF
jgi:hypothetical protein